MPVACPHYRDNYKVRNERTGSSVPRRPLRLRPFQGVFAGTLVSLGILNHWPGAVSRLGFSAILTMLVISSLLLLVVHAIRPSFPLELVPVIAFSYLLVSVYCVGVVVERFSVRSIMVVGQLLSILTLFVLTTYVTWDTRGIRLMATVFTTTILSVAVFQASLPMNENILGALIGFLLFWPMAGYIVAKNKWERLIWLAIISIGVVAIFHIGARSVWLALVAVFVVYIVFPVVGRSRTIYLGTFVLLVFALLSGMYAYTELHSSSLGAILQDFVLDTTGRDLFSGRHRLWPPLLDAIRARPWIGYGPSATPSLVMNTRLSSHNLYLQIALQVGIAGLGMFLGVLYALWRIYWLGKDDRVTRLSAAFLVGIMVHQMFEVSMTQNHMAIGITQWLALGVGVSRVFGWRRRNQRESPST